MEQHQSECKRKHRRERWRGGNYSGQNGKELKKREKCKSAKMQKEISKPNRMAGY
jgi:hypothetical protein